MKKQNVRTLSFIVSTFTYLLVGAAIFDALESQTEENTLRDLESAELKYKREYNISNDDYKSLEDIVIKYHPYRTFPQWKFTGAFYFSLTVITTIGYGHSTPQTILGKIFCMAYAIVGIPLCLVMFQSVGERLNYFASFCIQMVKKCFRLRRCEVNQTELVFVGGVLAIAVITGGASMFSHYEGWTYFDSIYYCVITLTTIGFGDFVALQDKNDLSNTSYVILSFTFILFGLTVVASSMNLLVFKFLTMNTDDERREFTREVQRTRSLRLNSADLFHIVNGNAVCELEPEDLEDLRKENSFILCFPSRSSLGTYLQSKFSWRWRVRTQKSPSLTDSDSKKESTFNQELVIVNHTSGSPGEFGNNSSNNINMITSCDTNSSKEVVYDKKNMELAKYLQQNNGNNDSLSSPNRKGLKGLACPSCFNKSKGSKTNNLNSSNNSKSAPIELDNKLFSIKAGSIGLKKKSHYTIVRAPGEISHLLRAKLGKSTDNPDQETYTSSIPGAAGAGLTSTKLAKSDAKASDSPLVSTIPASVKSSSAKAKKSDSESEDKANAALEVSVFIDEDAESGVITSPNQQPGAEVASHLSPNSTKPVRRNSSLTTPQVKEAAKSDSSPNTRLKSSKNRRSNEPKDEKNGEQESLLGTNAAEIINECESTNLKSMSKKITSSIVLDNLNLPNDTEIIIEESGNDDEEEDLTSYKIVEV